MLSVLFLVLLFSRVAGPCVVWAGPPVGTSIIKGRLFLPWVQIRPAGCGWVFKSTFPLLSLYDATLVQFKLIPTPRFVGTSLLFWLSLVCFCLAHFGLLCFGFCYFSSADLWFLWFLRPVSALQRHFLSPYCQFLPFAELAYEPFTVPLLRKTVLLLGNVNGMCVILIMFPSFLWFIFSLLLLISVSLIYYWNASSSGTLQILLF